jgi:putative FmdB family regulatory protein
MPTYEYGCAACGNEWEQMQRITEPPTEVCPKCGKSEAHRLISAGTNFILKGGGWYSDLYSSASKSGGTKKADGASDAASHSTSSSDKTETKTESKSETKTESKPATTPSTTPSSSSS